MEIALPEKYVDLMRDPQNKLHLSIVSIWELTIKMSSGKLDIDKNITEIEEYILSRDYEVINVSFTHLKALFNLPKFHGDPFDRLLIAQAIIEDLTIISVDKAFQDYPVQVSW
jgi:PIN domain nuclease of toxin-antitoxin system